MKTKFCKICKKELPLHYFSKNKNCKDGYLNTCKHCQKQRKLAVLNQTVSTETKICPVCKQELSIDDFGLDRRSTSGFRWLCKNCELLHNNINQGKDKNYFRKLRIKVDPDYRNTINIAKRLNSAKHHELRLLNNARNRAINKNLEFNLTIDDIIIPKECPILETPFVMGKKGDYMYTPSIDRIDNSKGYIKGNIQIISMKANTMKNSASTEELQKFCKNILRYSLNNSKELEVENKESLQL